MHITASTHHIWGVNQNHQIWRCSRPCNGNWVQIGGALKQIDANDQEVWGVNRYDQIWKHPVDGSGSWTLVPGLLKHVSASGKGYIWGVNAAAGNAPSPALDNGCVYLVLSHSVMLYTDNQLYGVKSDDRIYHLGVHCS